MSALLSAVIAPTPAPAVEVTFPLSVDYEILRAALRKHLGEKSGGGARALADGRRLGTFVVRDPVIEPVEGRLRISGPASATGGLPVVGWCVASVAWNGHAEIVARPEIDRSWQLRLRDVDFQLYNTERQPASVATRLWTVIRDWSSAELETFAFDLGPPVEDVRTLLRSLSSPTGSLSAALDAPPARARGGEGCSAASRGPRSSPGAAHRGRARAGADPGRDPAVGGDARPLGRVPRVHGEGPRGRQRRRHTHRAPGPPAHGPAGSRGRARTRAGVGVDPVRPLFLRFWERLRAIVRRAGGKGGDDARALRYVVFLAAGDALTAIEAAAPAAGLDFSADGLRRLARTVAPGYTGDPLEYSDAPDSRLQELSGSGTPTGPPAGSGGRRPRLRAPGFLPGSRHDRRMPTRLTNGGTSRSAWTSGSRPPASFPSTARSSAAS